MSNNRPTEKMLKALRNFKIPDAEIQRMTFQQASAKLDQLIKGIRNANPVSKTDTSTADGAEYHAVAAPSANAEWPEPLLSAHIERLWLECMNKARDYAGEEHINLGIAMFKANILSQEQQFNIKFAKKIAEAKQQELTSKSQMVKEVRGGR